MDLIVAVCRVLANRSRLRLLRSIHAQPGTTMQVLAAAAALPIPETSKHLKRLAGVHLVQATPQGRYVRYTPARPTATNHPWLRAVQQLVQALCAPHRSNSTLGQVWNCAAVAIRNADDEDLIKLFTTYTHLRRLMILRQLVLHGPCSAEHLAVTLKMSTPAVHRHLHKLQRRGVLSVTDAPPQVWHITNPVGAGRTELFTAVLRALKAGRQVEYA